MASKAYVEKIGYLPFAIEILNRSAWISFDEHISDHVLWERILAALVKITLYALLIAYVVTGYVTASGLRNAELLFPINVAFARSDLGDLFMEAHFALKWVLLVVLGLHVLGTIKHSFIDRDNTFRNIWITKKG